MAIHQTIRHNNMQSIPILWPFALNAVLLQQKNVTYNIMLKIAEKSRRHFNDIAACYDDSYDGKFCSQAYGELKREVEEFTTGKWLDVSCGPGTLLSLMSHSPLQKYGIDFSEKMIEEARCNVGEDTELFVASADNLPFEHDTFDVVTCSFAFHHYLYPSLVLKELYRVMKSGATLIIADPYFSQPRRSIINPLLRFSNNGDYHMYGRKELGRLMRNNGFLTDSFWRINKHTFICRSLAVKLRK